MAKSDGVSKRAVGGRLRIKREHLQRWQSSYFALLLTKEKLSSHWAQFCSVTPIHGMRYLSEPKRPLVEKIWWLVFILVSVTYAARLAWQQYEKMINSPIGEIPEENYGNLDTIPFPAVTICDNRKSFIYHHPDLGEDNSRPKREAKLFICGDPHPLSEETNLRTLLEMAPPLRESCDLTNIFLKNIWINCTSMFKRIVTDVGVCHTFNMFSPAEIFTPGTEIAYDDHGQSSDWIPEESAYAAGTPRAAERGQEMSSPFPKRAENHLTVSLFNELLDKNLEILYCDSSDILGFKIILHNPHEVPMVGHRRNIWSPTEFNESSIGQYFLLPMERKLQLIVEPKLIKADKELMQFTPKHRNCFFQGERQLFFFKHYSYSNCQLECVANLTLEECHCADFYMPRRNGTKLCDRSNLGCIMTVLEDWKRRGGRNCSCLNSCNLIEYHAKAWYTYSPDTEEIVWNDTSLSVVMGDHVFLTTERKPMITKVDFIATIGGLFGLFCGMSILSVIEILYYGSFRILATLYYNWRHKDNKPT